MLSGRIAAQANNRLPRYRGELAWNRVHEGGYNGSRAQRQLQSRALIAVVLLDLDRAAVAVTRLYVHGVAVVVRLMVWTGSRREKRQDPAHNQGNGRTRLHSHDERSLTCGQPRVNGGQRTSNVNVAHFDT